LAEYYYETGNNKAKDILDKWVKWVLPEIHFEDGSFEIPSNMEWSGQPDTWEGSYTGNPDLHVTVYEWGKDLGITGSLANLLSYYAARALEDGDKGLGAEAKETANKLLNLMWDNYRDEKGIAIPEVRSDYDRFFEEGGVYIPKNWKGTNAQGATIQNGMTFLDMRPAYREDPDFDRLQECYDNGTMDEFTMTYHRFWAQVDIAMAYGVYGMLFDEPLPTPTNTKKPTPTKPKVTPTSTNPLEKFDVKKDGAINMNDVMVVAAAFNSVRGSSKYKAEYDFDNNGAINMQDIMLLAAHFNKIVG
jgi:hypothetical protein